MSNYPDGISEEFSPWRDNSAEVEAWNEAVNDAKEDIYTSCEDAQKAFEHTSNYPLSEDAEHLIFAAYCKAVNNMGRDGATKALSDLLIAMSHHYSQGINKAAESTAEEKLGYAIR